MSMIYKSVSLWYNRSGDDVMHYVEHDVAFDDGFLERAGYAFVEGYKASQFKEEVSSKGQILYRENGYREHWIMHYCDGIGVLCSDMDTFEAHAEYMSFADL